MPDLSLPMQARQLVQQNRLGCLSTNLQRNQGFPFGSLMPYAADGSPLLFPSSLAVHTRNLYGNARCSLLISPFDKDSLASPRVTLLGFARQVPAEEAMLVYLAQHDSARQWQGFTDFAYYRMEISTAYVISGFGSMGWVTADEYRDACQVI